MAWKQKAAWQQQAIVFVCLSARNMDMRRILYLTLVVGGIAMTGTVECRAQLPEGAGKATVQKECGVCHAAELVLGKAMSRQQWNTLVADMVTKGAKIADADFTQIVDYLAANLGPQATGGGGGRGRRARPRGPGGRWSGPERHARRQCRRRGQGQVRLHRGVRSLPRPEGAGS